MKYVFALAAATALGLVLIFAVFHSPKQISIGSKKFTESVILGDILTQLAQSEGYQTLHRAEIGGTRLLWNSLLSGEIDAYVEYTGTLAHEIYAQKQFRSEQEIEPALRADGVRASAPLGFDDTYALGMKRQMAESRGIQNISDLKNAGDLVFGLTQEFLARADGWPKLKQAYQLPDRNIKGLDHDFAYRAIQSNDIQVIDLYSTDAEIKYYDLKTLIDDRAVFPHYQAIILYRAELENTAPELVRRFKDLEGKISQSEMIRMNSLVKIDRVPEARVAARFLDENLRLSANTRTDSVFERVTRHLWEHLNLVFRSLTAAILFSIPMGILAARRPRIGYLVIAFVSTIQTIPALALLVVLIRPLNFVGLSGIGDTPAIVALFLYSLLPIVRNVHSGLTQMPTHITESADALGLPSWAKLIRVELPIASRTILAGIKTAAVINVGFATLGALVGAGGLGQPILSGIRLDDYSLILQGAIPAALLALAVQAFFSIAERFVVPRGLKL